MPFVAEAAGPLTVEARLRWLDECEAVIRPAQAHIASPYEVWREERAAAEKSGVPIFDGFAAFQEFDEAEKSGAFSILREAERLTSRSRRSSYGHPFDNFSKEAALINIALGLNLQAEDMPLIEILRKVARQTHCHKRDNLTDIAGYAQTRMLVEEEKERRREIAPLPASEPSPDLPLKVAGDTGSPKADEANLPEKPQLEKEKWEESTVELAQMMPAKAGGRKPTNDQIDRRQPTFQCQSGESTQFSRERGASGTEAKTEDPGVAPAASRQDPG
jgi:hypothetical protein